MSKPLNLTTRALSSDVVNQYPDVLLRKQQFDSAGMEQLSATRLKLYQECRYRFWRQYVIGEELPSHHSANFGKALHASIELFYKNGVEPKVTFVELVDEFDPYRQYQDYFTDSVAMLDRMDFSQYQPIATERPFVEQLTNNAYILGFMDLIDRRGWVVDFKSSKYKPATINNDLQFAIYAFAYTQLFGQPPRRVLWHHLRTGEVVDGDVDYLLSVTLPTAKLIANAILNDTFEDVRRCYECKYYCPYKAT